MVDLVRLPHSLRPLVRADGVVQLGSPPGRCLEVDGLTPAEVRYLTSLAGPASERSDRAAALAAGLDEEARERLVQRLRRLDAVLDVSDPPRARAMCGARRDRLRAAVQTMQAAGGTGGWDRVEARDRATVVVDDLAGWAGDVAVDRVLHGLRDRLREGGVGQVLGPVEAPRWWHGLGDHGAVESAQLVVPVLTTRTAAVDLRRLVETGIPHLPVVVTPGWVGIGPLAVPGAACAECVVRHEVPPEQLALEWGGPQAESPTLEHLAPVGQTPVDLVEWAVRWGARTALWVLDTSDGPGTADGTAERATTRVSVVAHSPVPRVERFAVHPDCWCTGRRATA